MAQQNGTEWNSSVGRIVWGHPSKLTQRQDNNEKPIFNEDGSPAMGIAFGLAIPKAQFLANEWPMMQAEAAKGYPGAQVPQNFSWKIKDGDTDKDSKGNPLSGKEGYAGCYILTCASNTGFPVSVFKWNGARYDQMSENEIKTGDFVSAAIRAVLNIPQKATHTPSLYINPTGVEFVGYGTALGGGGIDPMKTFGGRQHQLPPGASATPISSAPAGVGMPNQMQPNQMQPQGMAPGGAPGYPQGNQMQPQGMAPGGAPGYPQPAHDFVQNAGYPQQHQPQGAPMGTPMAGAPNAGQMGGYPAQGGMPPAAGAYPSNPGMMQPQGMPGMMPGR